MNSVLLPFLLQIVVGRGVNGWLRERMDLN